MCIKFVLRNNLIYPCLFILSLFLRMVSKTLFDLKTFNGIKTTFLIFVMVYLIQLIMGLFILLYRKKTNKPKKKKLNLGQLS